MIIIDYLDNLMNNSWTLNLTVYSWWWWWWGVWWLASALWIRNPSQYWDWHRFPQQPACFHSKNYRFSQRSPLPFRPIARYPPGDFHYILRFISWCTVSVFGVSRGCKDRAFNTYNGSCQIGLSNAKSWSCKSMPIVLMVWFEASLHGR